MPLKINIKSFLLYALCAAAMAFCNRVVEYIPLSLGVYLAMLLCGAHILISPLLYVAASAAHLNLTLTLLSVYEALFPAIIVWLYRRTGRKMRAEGAVYLILTLAPYVMFAPWNAIDRLITENPYILRAISAAVISAFCFFCYRSLYAVMFRLQRCRLKEDELLSLAVVYTVAGTGMFSLTGAGAYFCFCAAVTAFAVRLARSPSAIIAALVLSVPAALRTLQLQPVTALVIISVAALLFSGAGRFAVGAVTVAGTAAYMYYTGTFDCPAPFIVLYSVLLFLAFVLPSLPASEKLAALKRRLMVEQILHDSVIARNKSATGERLFRISEVFREIECAFLALDEEMDDNAARARIMSELKEKCCKNCERAKRCALTDVYVGFKRLIDSGCAKGRVNLIDLPSEMTAECARPTDVLNQLNILLNEYRRYMLETENARSGRKLLAEQARGFAEVMKDYAAETSHIKDDTSSVEDLLKKSLATGGIACPELYFDGQTNEVNAVTVGKADARVMAKIISKAMNRRYALKDKLDFDGEKRCFTFGAPPLMDAAFGMAYAIKGGGTLSGDTHSVIRINDHSFLMALSDGMGSGKYARKVSEAAISLIEAFYRAQMPEDTVLKTINKLLSFNRDERFTCIDVAAINLDTGRADFVKIGSPAGVILRNGEVKVLESQSLPLGILDNLKPAVCTEKLQCNDVVVFMSDGITSAFPSSTDLYEFLHGIKALNPQNLADKLLAAALKYNDGAVTDDMTVLCARLFDNA